MTLGVSGRRLNSDCADYSMVPITLGVTENFICDNFFIRGSDSLLYQNVLSYLLNRRSVDIIMKNKKFEEAIVNVLMDLEIYRGRLDNTSKELDGQIEFRLGDKSTPEDITVKGNVTAEEKNFLLYLMAKFKNVEMPMSETIGYEQYHTIYFFSLNIKPYVPAFMRDKVDKEIFFTMIPKDKYKVKLDANKKKIKDYIRSSFTYYW